MSNPRPDASATALIARGLTKGFASIAELGGMEGLLECLCRHRQFPELVALGSALTAEKIELSPRGRRLFSQGLIEMGRLKEARDTLARIIDQDSSPAETLEARGLLGRIQKRVYINEAMRGKRDAAALRSATNEYLAAYDDAKSHPVWHGINAAALLARAQRDKVSGLPVQRQKKIATDVRNRLTRKAPKSCDYWDMATIAEASLVLGDPDGAELWFQRAARLPETNSFHLASTVRQLREVWQMTLLTDPGVKILPPLDERLLELGHTALIAPSTVAEAAEHRSHLEKVFGSSPFMSAESWAAGMECAKSVCRVENKRNEGIGTGFVFHGKLLSPALPDEMVMITNAHVLSAFGEGDSITVDQAHAAFYANKDEKGRPHTSAVRKILWSSPPDQLDATLVTLETPPKLNSPLTFARDLPRANSKDKVYVIGHPRGGGLMFSLNDNELIDHADPTDCRVHYRTATEPGSSGSPVFNDEWELIALHHAGAADMEKIRGTGTYEANEGIAFKHIRPAVKPG